MPHFSHPQKKHTHVSERERDSERERSKEGKEARSLLRASNSDTKAKMSSENSSSSSLRDSAGNPNWNAILKWSVDEGLRQEAELKAKGGGEMKEKARARRTISEEDRAWFLKAIESGVVDEVKRIKGNHGENHREGPERRTYRDGRRGRGESSRVGGTERPVGVGG